MRPIPALLLMVPLCACAPHATAYLTPRAALDGPDELDVGVAQPGDRATARVELANVGDASGTWTLQTAAPFELLADAVTIAPGATATLDVRFAPSSWADADGALIAAADADALTVALHGALLTDADADGAAHVLAGGDDCDDADAAVFPGAPDACYDGVDADCAQDDDDDCDGDGAPAAVDCDDARADVGPTRAESRADGEDDDCDGLVDEHLWAAGELVITEVHPAAPSWFEVCSASTRDVRLDGLRVDTDAGPLPLPAGAALAPSECAAICANAVQGCAFTLSGLHVAEIDIVAISAEIELDRVTMDVRWPTAGARTRTLTPGNDASSNDAPEVWCLADGSPGVPNAPCDP
jgi:hypothetical protein